MYHVMYSSRSFPEVVRLNKTIRMISFCVTHSSILCCERSSVCIHGISCEYIVLLSQPPPPSQATDHEGCVCGGMNNIRIITRFQDTMRLTTCVFCVLSLLEYMKNRKSISAHRPCSVRTADSSDILVLLLQGHAFRDPTRPKLSCNLVWICWLFSVSRVALEKPSQN